MHEVLVSLRLRDGLAQFTELGSGENPDGGARKDWALASPPASKADALVA